MQIGMSFRSEFEGLYNGFAENEKLVRLLEIEGISPTQLDIGLASHNFFSRKLADIATDSNSNAVEDVSPSTYRAYVESNQMKLLGYHTLWHYAEKAFGRAFADKAISMIWDGTLYFHDAHGVKIQMPYCYAFSLDKLVLSGRPYGTSPNTPPKHRKSFISQVDKLIGDLSKQFAGATAPSDLFLWYAYFCKMEGIDVYNYAGKRVVIDDLQGLVCLFNESSRAEGESPFTNIGIYDMVGLQNLFGHIIYPDGSKPDMEYIMELQKIFCEWFSKGDPITGFPYRFPVVTINLTTDEHNDFIDVDTAKWAAHVNRRMGNFNLHFGDKAKLAMCCRYENDLEDIGYTPDSFGNGGVNIGSHRVITPHIARAAKLAGGDIDEFHRLIDEWFDVAAKLLIVHRRFILQKRIAENPDYLRFFGRLKWFNLNTMFSTFGITGINEACEFMGYDIVSEEGTEFVLDMLQYLKDKVKFYRKKYNVTFNIEEIPGEQACVALADKDRVMVDPDLPIKLYSNQYIPLTSPVDLYTRIDLSGRFMRMVSGGGISHFNIDNQIDSDGKMYELMRLAAKSGIPHMAVCHRFGMCANGHTNIVAQADNCPVCGAPIVRARNRVIGYFSDESNWHPVRRQFDARLRYFSGIGGDNGDE